MNIGRWVLAILLGLPILELYLLISVGAAIGFFPTLILLFAAGSGGAYLLQTQGLSTWTRLQQQLARRELPAKELLDGTLIMAGGILLMIPGFLSDIFGLLCLIPISRKFIGAYLIKHGLGIMQTRAHEHSQSSGPATIEGEYKRED